MEVNWSVTIPDNVAAGIQNGSATPLTRRLFELAAIKAYESNLMTEDEVMEMLGFEDQEELDEFLKQYDARSKYTAEDFAREGEMLDALLAKHGR